MKKINKYCLSLACLLGIGGMTGIALATNKNVVEVKADAITTGMLYVGGQDIVEQGGTITDAAGGYAQLVGTTLTFHNYSYEGIGYVDGDNAHYGLYYDAPIGGSLNFVIEGHNTISMPSSSVGHVTGFYVKENKDDSFSFTGNGSLTINVNGVTKSDKNCNGMWFRNKDGASSLYSTGKLTFNGPSLVVNDINTSAGGNTFGINLDQGSYNIPFEMKSGSIDIRSEGKAGHNMTNYAFQLRDFTMENGSINIKTINEQWATGLWFDHQGYNIGATVNINGGSINVEVQSSGTYVYGASIRSDYDHRSYLNIGDSDHVEAFNVSGNVSAISYNGSSYTYVTNKLAGTGYDNIEGTGEGTPIPANETPYQISTSFKCVKFTGKQTSVITEDAYPVSNLQYTGSALILVTPATGDGGTIVYRIGETGDFSANLPTAINAGTYEIYYKVQADADHKDSEVQHLTASIAKANSAFATSPTAKTDLVVNGQAQALVNAGASNDGTVVYRLGESGDFAEAIPTGTEAGTYTVQYKILGDANHNDSEVSSVNVTIAAAPTPGPTPGPEPTPTPVDPSDNGGLPGWGIALIAVGSVIGLLGIGFVVLFFLLNKWIKVGDKAVRVMRFALGTKDGKQRYLAFPCKFAYRSKEEVFNTKKDALK